MADDIRIKAPFTELQPGKYRYYAPGDKEPRVVVVVEKDDMLYVRFTKGMYPTPLRDLPAMGEFAKVDEEGPVVEFSKLWVGDRFQRVDGRGKPMENEVWTKLDRTCARRHGPEETRWGGLSYGYVGSATCSFEQDEKVKFVPVPL